MNFFSGVEDQLLYHYNTV